MIFQSGDIAKVINMPERTGMNGWIGTVMLRDSMTLRRNIKLKYALKVS
jgi:ribosomal protein S28E/S33